MGKPSKKKYTGKYDPQLRIAIAREYLTSELGYKSLAVRYNIPVSSVVGFVKWYQAKYPDGVVHTAAGDSAGTGIQDDTQLKITALEMLIENAGKELGIDLVKKFGTKQQNK